MDKEGNLMKRQSFDLGVSWVGALLVAVLLVSGSLLLVAWNFADSNVQSQLKQQQIFFPQANDPQLKDPQIGPFLTKYAGQQLVNGAQAEAYANHFIAVHLKGVADGKTYSQVSGEWIGCISQPGTCSAEKTATLADQRQTLFTGETLRGLLLNAYGFWTFGQIAKTAGFGAFAAAAILLVLTILGFVHARRTPAEAEVLVPHNGHKAVAAIG